jgi:hypothetical protein
VIWRILLTVLYTGLFGALMALENSNPGMSDVPLLATWLAAPVVGFLVGRWWVLLAVAGEIIGRAIGWDPGENDGNPAFWPPYVVSAFVLLGLPLLLGVAAARRRSRSSIAEEVERLATNEADRTEMRAVREQAAELAPEVD